MTGLEILFVLFIIAALYEACCMLINYIYDCMVYVCGGATTAELAREKQRRIDAMWAEEHAKEQRRERLALWRLKRGNDILRELQRVRELRCVQNHPHILQQTMAKQTVAKPLVGPVPEQDSGETEKERILNRLIRAGTAVPAHGRG